MDNIDFNEMFSPVEVKRAYDVVYDKIEDMILSGKLKYGDRLPSERQLMTMFNRSHPTIREALRMLEGTGYVRSFPGESIEVCYSGSDLAKESFDELLQFKKVSVNDLYQFIILTEPEFVKISAEQRTWEDICDLDHILSQMRANPDGRESADLSPQFHLRLIQTCHNPLAYLIWQSIITNCGDSFSNYTYTPTSIDGKTPGKKLTILKDMIEALRDKNPQRASLFISAFWNDVIKDTLLDPQNPLSDAEQMLYREKEKADDYATLKVSSAIYEQIRSKILSGELKEGQQLPSERDLIEIFHRSRPTIREALRMLETKKYISISRGTGIVVNKLTTSEVERSLNNMIRLKLISYDDLREVRRVTEGVGAALAAKVRTEEDIEITSGILERSRSKETSPLQAQAIAVEFNKATMKMTHNQIFILISKITAKLTNENIPEKLMKLSLEGQRAVCEKDIQQHSSILDAIIEQNPEKAKQMSDIHLLEIFNSLA